MEKEQKKKRITFFLKDEVVCPVCDTHFKREELLSGGGRLIAGGITKELRRLYEPSKVYGKVNPLLYPVTVCPKCFLSAFHEDWKKLKPKGIEKLKETTAKRQGIINRVFPNLDFKQERETRHGAASYILAAECYEYFDKWVSPTVKRAICSLRAAWLFGDLEVEDPMADYGNLQNLFYKKALQFYSDVLVKQQRAEESFDGIKSLGPDTDQNYGYDGILFLVGSLSYKLSYMEKHTAQTVENLEKAKRVLSKMFGFGKASKDKPSVIIDMSRDVYEEIAKKVEDLRKELHLDEQSAGQTEGQDTSSNSAQTPPST